MKTGLLFALLILLAPKVYGETTMDKILPHVEINDLPRSAKEINSIYNQTIANGLSGFEANSELFGVFLNSPFNSAAIYLEDYEKLRDLGKIDVHLKFSIDEIRETTGDFSSRITPSIFKSANVELYLDQITSINKKILSIDKDLFSDDERKFEDFKYYQYLIGNFELALGFVDYEYNIGLDDSNYWPDEQHAKAKYKFINLFRGSEAEKAKSQKFASRLNEMSPQERLAAYAWVYEANYEEFLAVSETSDDLPPWIESDELRALHRSINEEFMSEFRLREEDMYE